MLYEVITPEILLNKLHDDAVATIMTTKAMIKILLKYGFLVFIFLTFLLTFFAKSVMFIKQ